MRLLSITLKDLTQSSRTLSAYIFMFVIPILVTFLFFLMFSGIRNEEEGFQLPRTSVVIVNLDSGQLPAGFASDVEGSAGSSLTLNNANNMGELLSEILLAKDFADIMLVSLVADEAEARGAVDRQEAGVAIIIPANFTDAIMGQDNVADNIADTVAIIEFYQDPTLTFGLAIVQGVVAQLLEGFSANEVAISTTLEQLAESGVAIDQDLVQGVIQEFVAGQDAQGSALFGSSEGLIAETAPAGSDETVDLLTQIVSVILAGMMVFFAFFTGAAQMESILVEEEKGTLARLFTTPNSHRTILGGKTFAVLITLVVQVTVLLLFGAVVFNIDWGEPLAIIIAGVGLVIVAAATGLFLVSFLQNTRQSGIIFGGVLTLTGMIGLIPIFTAGVPGQSEAVKTVSLFVPQGWTARGFVTAIEGGTAAELLPIFAVTLLWSVVFAAIGQRRLQRRFA